jgi:hypothetical protein
MFTLVEMLDFTSSKANMRPRTSLPGLVPSNKPHHEVLDGILLHTSLLAHKEAKPCGKAPPTAFTQYAMGSVPYAGSHSYVSGKGH